MSQQPPNDARSARAQAKAAKAHAKAMRPFYKKKRFIGLAVIVVAVIGGVASSAGSKDSGAHKGDSKKSSNTSTSTLDHSADVKILACEVDGTTGWMDAKLAVTNPSSKVSNYAITIAFDTLDGKTQLDTALTSASSVNPGQTAKVTAQTLTKGSAGQFKCSVKEALRTAA